MYLTLKLEGAPSGVNLADYEYQVRAPSGTGVQVDRSSTCVRPSWTPTKSAWYSAETTSTGNYKGIYLLRCGFGDGVTNLKIWLRHRATSKVFSSASYSRVMRQPWHDQDRYITYQIGCMPAPTGDLDFAAGIKKAADAWNKATNSIEFGKYPAPDCKNLHKSGRVTVSIGTSCDGHALACAPNDSRPADYPHLTDRRIVIRDPPIPGYKWTTNSTAISNLEYYLPMVMIHEFGHSAGLVHSDNSSDLMRTGLPNGKIINSPSRNDIDAMEDINH